MWAVAASLVLFVWMVRAQSHEDVAGCGGFVVFPADHDTSKIDFSAIKVSLLSAGAGGGAVKYRTEPAPNGYFFVPISGSDSMEYVLTVDGPAGWTYGMIMFMKTHYSLFTRPSNSDPQRTTVSLKQCKDKDINFNFMGFSVRGAVVIPQHDSAQFSTPQVTLSTLPLHKTSSISTPVSNTGSYSFQNVLPGQFRATPSLAGFRFSPAHQDVTVGWNNANIEPFHAAGYPVQGKVSAGKEPIKGVRFYLYPFQVRRFESSWKSLIIRYSI